MNKVKNIVKFLIKESNLIIGSLYIILSSLENIGGKKYD
jgi:hypothetical protein